MAMAMATTKATRHTTTARAKSISRENQSTTKNNNRFCDNAAANSGVRGIELLILRSLHESRRMWEHPSCSCSCSLDCCGIDRNHRTNDFDHNYHRKRSMFCGGPYRAGQDRTNRANCRIDSMRLQEWTSRRRSGITATVFFFLFKFRFGNYRSGG
eukprot:jgi/Psemu1/309162/fgenesh1_kg.479_\